MDFGRFVTEDPETAFSDEQGAHSAGSLWEVMRRGGEDRQASRWNRRFLEELGNLAKGLYEVDHEAVTGEENRTDTRLRSVVSDQEAVIEIKRADERSGRELRDTIFDQYVQQYLRAENTMTGCLWSHWPETGSGDIRTPEKCSTPQG